MSERPNSTERWVACANHVSSLWFPILGPFVFYAFSRNRSKFVSAHSLQALLEFIALKIVLVFAMAASFVYSGLTLYHALGLGGAGMSSGDVVWMVLKALLVWLALGLVGLIVNTISIFQALHALRGKWPRAFARQSNT